MKIAVLMSTYNGEKYLGQQIDSILAQQGPFQLSLIVRDDGSSDGTRGILKAYASRGQIRWYTGENLGPAKSFLTLLKDNTGYDYYSFADQDDYWYPDKLQRGIAAIGDCPSPMLYCSNSRLVDGEGAFLGRNVFKTPIPTDFRSRVCSGGVTGCTMIFNRALAELVQAKPLPEKLVMHDSYLGILAPLFGADIHFDMEPSMDYRQHGNNVVGTNWTKLDAIKERIRTVTKPQKVSIAEQAASLLALYPESPNREYLDFLQRVADYRRSFGRALSLALSRKVHYYSKNTGIAFRFSIILRNL